MESDDRKADDPGMHPPAQPTSANGDPAQQRSWFGRRKRVLAREVSTAPPTATANEDPAVAAVAAIEREMRTAALAVLKPVDVIDLPPQAPPSESVIDPTAFSERHRKHGQNLAYRLTQISTGASVAASLAAILAALLEDAVLAQVLATVSCVFAVLAVRLVRSSRLAYRLRGYAAACAAIAVVSLVISILPNLFHDEPRPAPQPKPAPAAQP